MAAWRRYRVRVEFQAPLPFAYAWCTDYTPEDAKYAGEDRTIHLQRRIIVRSRRRVVFENLYQVGKGWGWERHEVTLFPPRQWHSEGKGNYHESVLDYELRERPGGRTQFRMSWRSRPIGLGRGPRPDRRLVERYVTSLWKRRAKVLAREYRQSRRKP